MCVDGQSLRRMLAVVGGLLLIGLAPARAGVFFLVSDGANKLGLVYEQIAPGFVPGVGAAYDYQFYLLNVAAGTQIDNFGASVGPKTGGNLGGFVGPAPGVAFATIFGLANNASVPFLNAQDTGLAWQFTESDDRGFPITGYDIDWDSNHLVVGGPVLAGDSLPFLFWQRFDLFSPFGPTGGIAGIDPMHVDSLIVLDPGGSPLVGTATPPGPDQLTDLLCGGPNQPPCTTTPDWGSQDPTYAGAQPAGRVDSIPEPPAAAVIGGALLALGALRRRRRKVA